MNSKPNFRSDFFRGASLKPVERARPSLWSAATCRRFARLADLSAKQRRAERGAETPVPTAFPKIMCLTVFDGDKSPAESGDESPHSKGFALSMAAPLYKP